MRFKSFSAFFRNALLIVLTALIITTIVKSVNILLLTGSFSIIFSQKMIVQLVSVAVIPDLITYTILIAIGYHFMKKNAALQDEQIQRNLDIEKKQATYETAQKMTGLMIDVIGEYNNQIKTWIYQRQQRGQQPPEKIQHASTMIGRSLLALTEFSYLHPYIEANNATLDKVIEDLRMQLKENHILKQVEVNYSIQ